MIRKMMKGCVLTGAMAFLAAACSMFDAPHSKYEGYIPVSFGPASPAELNAYLNEFFHGGEDTVSVNKNVWAGPVLQLATVGADGSLVGGTAIAIGIDTVATLDRKPSRFAVFDKGGNENSFGYGVFHDTTATLMPEHAFTVAVPNDESSCVANCVYVQNVQAVIQAALYGVGLADGPFREGDHLTLTIQGYLKGTAGATKSIKLIDGTRPVGEWKRVDLDGFGKIDALDFRLASSRPDLPLYCCLDDLVFHYIEIY